LPSDIFKVGSSIRTRSMDDSAGGTDRGVCFIGVKAVHNPEHFVIYTKAEVLWFELTA
jgi:hypothetical protein